MYAVDPSGVTAHAEKLIATADLSSQISVLQSRIEDVQLPVPNVDIIVSQWMGHCLLLDSLAPAVIYARDKFLAPGGHILPNKASLKLVGIEDREYLAQQQKFWKNVYGFNGASLMTQVSGA